MYDADVSAWKHLTYMPQPRHHHAVAVLGGFLYVAGGESTNDHCSPVKTVFRFDPRNKTWLQVACMNYSRQSFQMAVLHGHIYALGGRINKNESLDSVERYDPSKDVWNEVASLSIARRCIAVSTLNGRLYAVGGSGNNVIYSRVERYNPFEDKWECRKSTNVPRFSAHLITVHTRLYLLGGATIDASGNIKCLDTIETYTPSTDTWVLLCGLKSPKRAEFGCTLVGDRIYMCGGYNWDDNQRLVSAEYLDITEQKWHQIGPITAMYTGIACCLLTVYDLGKDG
ncbi:hypothetical protein ScPMuIL_018239 [Solemya velum]